jgi:hypothetical protein
MKVLVVHVHEVFVEERVVALDLGVEIVGSERRVGEAGDLWKRDVGERVPVAGVNED